MRTGYAIRDSKDKAWLNTRTRVEGVNCPVTVWVEDDADAMQFRRLKDAKTMLRVIRREHRRPDKVHILDPKWRVIA